jgi:hypothetical protein
MLWNGRAGNATGIEASVWRDIIDYVAAIGMVVYNRKRRAGVAQW